MKNFKHKIVVITGAGSGMGKEYARQFGELGAKLALNDYNQSNLQKVKEELHASGVKDVLIDAFDVTNKEKMFAFAGKVKKQYGNAHLVINNAGVEGLTVEFNKIKLEDYERIMDINFRGVLYGCKAFLPQLLENNEGAIVNVSSVFGLLGIPTQSDYCASKFAVRGLSESLYVELINSPINVHIVHPGGINTSIAKNELSAAFAEKYLTTTPEKIVKHIIKSIRKNKFKIVYGRDSMRVWFASNFIPKGLIKYLLHYEMKKKLKYEV